LRLPIFIPRVWIVFCLLRRREALCLRSSCLALDLRAAGSIRRTAVGIIALLPGFIVPPP
jgi:hypothetical protein